MEDFVSKVKTKYEWLSNADVEDIVNKAKFYYYSIKYNALPLADETSHPISGFKNEMWILSACDELVERLGFSSATGYKENGVDWSFDGAVLSNRLISMLKPIVGSIN